MRSKKSFYFGFFVIITGIIAGFLFFEKVTLPVIDEVSHEYAQSRINMYINSSVAETVTQMDLSADKFIKTEADEGKVKYISMNTVLINSVCSDISKRLTKRLSSLEQDEISLPIGLFTGFNLLSDVGPKYTFSVLDIGEARVDYETGFESQGINQINYKVWLNIEVTAKIINSDDEPIKISRKMMLINTVFNGEVPNFYMS